MGRFFSCCFLLIQLFIFSTIIHNHWGFNFTDSSKWSFWDNWKNFAILESFFWLCFLYENTKESKKEYLYLINDNFSIVIVLSIAVAPIACLMRLILYSCFILNKGIKNFWKNIFFANLMES